MKEKEFHDEVRVALQDLGFRTFRNNNGLYRIVEEGKVRTIKYGLGNGTGDIIGWRSVVVTPEMVGQKVAVFVSAEGKQGAGTMNKDQKMFAIAVRAAGGIAFEYRSAEDAVEKAGG